MRDTLQLAIKGDPSATALIIPSRPYAYTVTYTSLGSQVYRLQKQLAALGITRGSIVVTSLDNSWELIAAFLAISWQRSAAAPLDPALSDEFCRSYLTGLNISLVLGREGSWAARDTITQVARTLGASFAECYWDSRKGLIVLSVKYMGRLNGRRHRILKPRAEDIAVILPTSEHYPLPKAVGDVQTDLTSVPPSDTLMVPLTHGNLVHATKMIRDDYQLTETDRSLLVMPLFRDHGLICGLLAPLCTGGSVVVPPKLIATDFWTDFTTHRANWYTADPHAHQMILEAPTIGPTPMIRFIRSSEPLSVKLSKSIMDSFGAPVMEAYTMTQASHHVMSIPSACSEARFGGVSPTRRKRIVIRILDDLEAEVSRGTEGDIYLGGRSVMKGYLSNSGVNVASFTNNGLFRTGDRGITSAHGHLEITGQARAPLVKIEEEIKPVKIHEALTKGLEVVRTMMVKAKL